MHRIFAIRLPATIYRDENIGSSIKVESGLILAFRSAIGFRIEADNCLIAHFFDLIEVEIQ